MLVFMVIGSLLADHQPADDPARLIPLIAGRILEAKDVHDAYVYIGGLVMIYAVLAIIAILRTPETKHADLEQ